MDEFCPQFDRRVCQGGMYGPDASTNPAPRFENRYVETCLAERLRAREPSNSSSDHHNLGNPFGHAFSASYEESAIGEGPVFLLLRRRKCQAEGVGEAVCPSGMTDLQRGWCVNGNDSSVTVITTQCPQVAPLLAITHIKM